MSDAVPTYPDPETERGVREQIREKVRTPGHLSRAIAVQSVPETTERIPLPIRLPKMYYEALKEYSVWTGQSMNAIAVEAIGEYLKKI